MRANLHVHGSTPLPAWSRRIVPPALQFRRHLQCRRHSQNLQAAYSLGTSPSSVVDAFLASAKQTAEPLADGESTESDDRNCDVEGRCRTGPDTVVALLADEIIGAAFDHARELRTPEESIDVNLELCLQAAYSRSNIPVRAEDAERAPPFLDSFGVRALMYAGVIEHSLLSSVQVSEKEHAARYKVEMCGGEIAVLTFQLVLEKGVRAAYRGIASESSWVLQRVCGEWDDLQDTPHERMGPEGTMNCYLSALQQGDIASAFKFVSRTEHHRERALQRYTAQLESPLFRPLISHLSSKVLMCRQKGKQKVSAVIKLVPDPRKMRSETNGSITESSDALYLLTVSQEDGQAHTASDGTAQDHGMREQMAVWAISSVKVVPVQFVNAWPQRRT